jgi:primosomal protein N' (replication factor Y) (superfamily II helicase)
MRYAQVAVHAPVSTTFHYHIPPELEDTLQPGHLVRVAFGTGMEPGIVLALDDTSPVEATKPVLELLDPLPVVDARQIALAHWLSERYLAPPGLCLWLMLPPGIVGQRDILVTLLLPEASSANDIEAKVIEALQRRGPLRGTQLSQSVGRAWRKAVTALREAGTVKTRSVLAPPRVRPQMIQVAALAIHPDRLPDTLRFLGGYSREADLLEAIVAMLDEDDAAPTVQQIIDLPGIGRGTLDKVVREGLVSISDDHHVLLEFSPQDLDQVVFALRHGERDLRILRILAREGDPVDVSWIYAQTGAKLADLKRLAEREFIHLGEKETRRDSLAERDFVPMAAPRLTPAQRTVWQQLRTALDRSAAAHERRKQRQDPLPASPVDGEGEPHVESSQEEPLSPAGVGSIFLLHGVTGSGKTELYLRAIERVIARGQQAVFLVPEIALTAQTVRRVGARFPGRLAVVHSGLSEGERFDTWRRARAGEIDVVVGARSALFTPLPDIGLVILDEEHDGSYKQSPPLPPPHYHTRDVAERMMRDNGGVLILGSATPDIEVYFRARRGEIAYLHLPERIMGHRIRIAEQSEREGVLPRYSAPDDDLSDALTIPLPPVEVVDLRAELRAGNTAMFSRALHTALAETLMRGEQAILFLNRRGAATHVFCRDCGYVASCPRCDMPLTYHRSGTALHCHHCGHREGPPDTCPLCGSSRIRFFGAGTQQVEETLREHFPAARSLRWDADTAAAPGAHDVILQRFMNRQADVLIGTQMVAKGLDIPLVTLVGVVSADLGLALPDFRAGERTFQLLAQVAGRAGRGLLGGRVILQTYHPEHYAIAAAADHDYEGFYKQEIIYRQEMGYPPFRRLARVLFQYDNATRAQDEALRAAAIFEERIQRLELTGTSLIGPAPCFFSRVDRLYRWQLLLRSPDPTPALLGLDFPRGWYVDIDPVDIL